MVTTFTATAQFQLTAVANLQCDSQFRIREKIALTLQLCKFNSNETLCAKVCVSDGTVMCVYSLTCVKLISPTREPGASKLKVSHLLGERVCVCMRVCVCHACVCVCMSVSVCVRCAFAGERRKVCNCNTKSLTGNENFGRPLKRMVVTWVLCHFVILNCY